MKKIIFIMGLFAAISMSAINAYSAAISYTDTGTGSGTLAGIAFDADFTIYATGDTLNRQVYEGGYFIDNATASIDIDGVGSLDFITPTRFYVNNELNIVGFSRAGEMGLDLYAGPTDTLFTAWDMLSSIGPISGTGSLLQWSNDIETSAGILVFEDGFSSVEFQATVGVPEPATLLLLSLGVAGLAVIRKKF